MKKIREENINIEFTLYSFRKYGEPKLKKPKELNNIKQTLSVDYIPKKCKCQIYIKGNDVWIKHKDYFSSAIPPESHELGMPLNYFAEKYLGKNRPAKFIYHNSWGSVIARNEAWIVVRNLVNEIQSGKFELDIVNKICRQQEKYHQLEEYELCSTDMERFWENVVKKIKNIKQ